MMARGGCAFSLTNRGGFLNTDEPEKGSSPEQHDIVAFEGGFAMKQVINRKLYSTETAEYLGGYSYGSGSRDFHHMTEELYRKTTGEFFLYGEGGPATKYREQVETNSWRGGERILPFTEDEAKDWVEAHLSGEKYIEIFGEPEE